MSFLIACQKMYDEAVDDCLAALKFIPNMFVTSKIITKLLTALYADDNILYFKEYSGNARFCCNEMGILDIDLNKINLGETNYDEHYPETIIDIRLLACILNLKNAKHLKKR